MANVTIELGTSVSNGIYFSNEWLVPVQPFTRENAFDYIFKKLVQIKIFLKDSN